MSNSRAVWVLGGGGVAGIAWETGLLTGLADEGVTISPEAVLLGTSAGAVVTANVAAGVPIAELYERQVAGVRYETAGGLGLRQILTLATAQFGARTPEQAAARIGRRALAAATSDPGRYLSIIEARLPRPQWSAADLRIIAVDAVSGTVRIFTRADGVGLVEAVAASCAVPLSAPPVMINGRLYMDGGMRSTVNLDLAPGAGPVIAIAASAASIGRWARIATQRAALGERTVEIIERDAASKKAQGMSVMDQSIVPVLAAAAREQGRREAPRVAKALS